MKESSNLHRKLLKTSCIYLLFINLSIFSLIVFLDENIAHARQTIYLARAKMLFYRFIALAPKTPAKAEATAITTFRIMSHTDFFIAIIYLLSVL